MIYKWLCVFAGALSLGCAQEPEREYLVVVRVIDFLEEDVEPQICVTSAQTGEQCGLIPPDVDFEEFVLVGDDIRSGVVEMRVDGDIVLGLALPTCGDFSRTQDGRTIGGEVRVIGCGELAED